MGFYCLMILIYLFRYEISYRATNASPQIIEQRDLTYREYKASKDSISIRNCISYALLIFSTLVFTISLFIWRNKSFESFGIVKITVGISLVWTLILLLAIVIKFIPTGPIR